MKRFSRRSAALMLAGITGTAVATQANSASADLTASSTSDSSNDSNLDQAEIINTVNGIALFADLRDWQRCRQSFIDQVEFDYSSLVGGEPGVIAADQQMQQWAAFFDSTFKITQHMVGSHVVSRTGNQATCVSQFQAHHTYLDASKSTWVLGGVYHHELVREQDGWKVSKMKMTWTWENGTRPF